MALILRRFWDWSTDTLGQLPDGWDEHWQGDPDGWEVAEYDGERVLEQSDEDWTDEPLRILVPEGTPETSFEMEIYAEGEITGYGPMMPIWLVADPWQPGTGYYLVLDAGRGEIVLFAMFGGSGFELASEPFSPDIGERYCVRVRHDAIASIHVKVWEKGEPEPENWLISVTGGYFSDGIVGLGEALQGHTLRWYAVGIDLEGGTAPSEPDDDDEPEIVEGSVSFTGSASLTAEPSRVIDGEAEFTGAASLTAEPSRVIDGETEFTGAASLTAAPSEEPSAPKSYGFGRFNRTPFNRTPFNRSHGPPVDRASLRGAGTFTAAGGVIRQASMTLTGAADLHAVLSSTLSEEARFGGEASFDAAAIRVRLASATFSGTADLSQKPTRLRTAEVQLTGQGQLRPGASVLRDGSISLTGQGSQQASFLRQRIGQMLLSGQATVSARYLRIRMGIAWLQGAAATFFGGGQLIQGGVSFTGEGQMPQPVAGSHQPEIIRLRVRGVAAKRLPARGVAHKRFVVR